MDAHLYLDIKNFKIDALLNCRKFFVKLSKLKSVINIIINKFIYIFYFDITLNFQAINVIFYYYSI